MARGSFGCKQQKQILCSKKGITGRTQNQQESGHGSGEEVGTRLLKPGIRKSTLSGSQQVDSGLVRTGVATDGGAAIAPDLCIIGLVSK